MKYAGVKFPDFLQVISQRGVTRSIVKLFYESIVAGRFRGKETERWKIEAKINAAVKAGQVSN